MSKTVLITGSSEGGIGDALAKSFHKKGHRVFATARNLSKVEHLRKLGIEILALDVVDSDSINSAVEGVSKLTGGKLDILVNNSGRGYIQPLLDADISEARKMFDVNVFALIEVVKAFSPLLIASKGTIVNIGSTAGKFPMPWQGFYNASKAAVNLLTDQLRIELAPFGVRAVNVTTGSVTTKFFDNLDPPKLVPGSLYMPAKETIDPFLAGELAKDVGMDVDKYADIVSKNALKTNPTKNQWVGGEWFRIWLAYTFGWDTIWDFVLKGPFKLGEVSKKIQAAQKSKAQN